MPKVFQDGILMYFDDIYGILPGFQHCFYMFGACCIPIYLRKNISFHGARKAGGSTLVKQGDGDPGDIHTLYYIILY